MARSLVRAGRAEAVRLAGVAQRARAIGRADLAAQLDDSARALQRGAATVEAAELYWVAGPMARLAMDASQDVPAILTTDAPAAHGLMVFAEPLPAWDTTGTDGLALRDGARTDVPYHDPVPVDALSWAITAPHHRAHAQAGAVIRVELHTRPARLPLPLMEHQCPFLVPFTTITQPIPAALDAGGTVLAPAGVATAAEHVGVLALLQAAWVLMSTPSVATTAPAAPAPRAHGPARRPGPCDVSVIDVRPARRARLEPHDTATPSGRRLTTRHVVRGHWTHQPHGPGHQHRRLQWIDDYLRGPADAPITTRTHVWAWRH
ncbi:hypothetical protein [Actinomyces gaoshouyii]|uniref:hypothetical protein n=1 Tax=Actinomyces gaoshouyii TaxID=1960083 RepID=UPI0009BDC390|nr:hypothetical protein [Actinomyces gaoshouyii]ARD42470.1 hypothetical protein B6G06_09080 [Actinomyces gaoshouyii]